jgi:hypothetical protein
MVGKAPITIMTEYSFVAIVVGMIFAMVFGNAIGGYAGDVVIEETSKVFEMCKTNPEKFWEEYCYQIQENFDDAIKRIKQQKDCIN